MSAPVCCRARQAFWIRWTFSRQPCPFCIVVVRVVDVGADDEAFLAAVRVLHGDDVSGLLCRHARVRVRGCGWDEGGRRDGCDIGGARRRGQLDEMKEMR